MKLIDLEKEGIKAILFDCDGTLVDTLPAHFAAWETVFNKYEVKLELSYLDRFNSCPSYIIAQNLIENKYLVGDPFLIAKEKEDLYFEYLLEAKLLENVFEYVKFYHSKMPMIVLSGGVRRGVLKSLEFYNLLKYFDKIIAADDKYGPKTEPKVFLDIADEFKIQPNNWVVFEDGQVGLDNARRAGMRVIDVRQSTFIIV